MSLNDLVNNAGKADNNSLDNIIKKESFFTRNIRKIGGGIKGLAYATVFGVALAGTIRVANAATYPVNSKQSVKLTNNNLDAGLVELLYGPKIRWRKECAGIVNSQYMPDAYCGGIDVGTESTPEFCDIDDDDDYDLFVGYGYIPGSICFFRNDGTPEIPNWTLVTENYNSIDMGWFNTPTFCDIDNDGDYDLFVGYWEGSIAFYRNDGSPEIPKWTLVTRDYTPHPGYADACTFCDIDNDGDYDMSVLVNDYDKIYFYRNDGTPEVPEWTLFTEYYNFIDVSTFTTPTFHDIDNDGDYDMFVPETWHHVRFYKNYGTPEVPNWKLVTENYNSMDVERFSTLRFCDIDNDGDYDMFMGEGNGGISFWRNMGLEKTLKADLNNDGIVNFKDFAKFAEQWLMEEPWYNPSQ